MVIKIANSTKASRIRLGSLIFIMIFIYAIENIPFISISNNKYYYSVIQPLIWVGVIGIIFLFPRVRFKCKIRLQSLLRWWAVYLAIIYIVLMYLGGIIEGFGKSPYDISVVGILKNVIFLGPILIGRELIRTYVINSISNKKKFIVMIIMPILMTIFSTPLYSLNNLNGFQEIIRYIGEYFLPELTKNIFATYLVYIGGASLSIVYLGLLQAYAWVIPILPDLKWITKALIGTLCPVFSLMFLQYIYAKEAKEIKNDPTEKENPLGWIATSVLSVSIVWFAVGIFPIYPSVIATGSMKPMIQPGDVVIIKKIDGVSAKIGDVVQYKKDDIYIFHRIIRLVQVKNQLKFITKGDNNSTSDMDPVDPGMVKGIVINVIPKVGWPTLLLKSRDAVPKSKVEF